jgi:hypothetical protein
VPQTEGKKLRRGWRGGILCVEATNTTAPGMSNENVNVKREASMEKEKVASFSTPFSTSNQTSEINNNG